MMLSTGIQKRFTIGFFKNYLCLDQNSERKFHFMLPLHLDESGKEDDVILNGPHNDLIHAPRRRQGYIEEATLGLNIGTSHEILKNHLALFLASTICNLIFINY